jgi:hypothetical protein
MGETRLGQSDYQRRNTQEVEFDRNCSKMSVLTAVGTTHLSLVLEKLPHRYSLHSNRIFWKIALEAECIKE